jgi:hypothetical protein
MGEVVDMKSAAADIKREREEREARRSRRAAYLAELGKTLIASAIEDEAK